MHPWHRIGTGVEFIVVDAQIIELRMKWGSWS